MESPGPVHCNEITKGAGGGGEWFSQQSISTRGWSMMFTQNRLVAAEKTPISRKVNLIDTDYSCQGHHLMLGVGGFLIIPAPMHQGPGKAMYS